MGLTPEAPALHMHSTCTCGRPTRIKSTGECSACYQRRRRAERRALFPGQPEATPASGSTRASLSESELPPEVAAHPLRAEAAWVALRDSGIAPRDASAMLTTQQARDEFLVGAWLLNATTKTGMLGNITPQMLQAVDVLAAAMSDGVLISAILMPRRSGKTTVILCVLLGRCYLNPVHFAGFTLLTTQKKAAERYRLDVYGPIFRRWPDAVERKAFAKGAPVKLVKSNGNERVEFANGSNLAVLSPEGDAIRSGAYDSLLLDEGGEATIDRWEDVIGAVIPSFDTRPEGQLILAGTAGDYQAGSVFWATLNDPSAGRLNFSLPDDSDPEELEAWEPDDEHPRARAKDLVLSMHPGIDTLTTLDRIHGSYKFLGVKKFTREYFNIFGAEGSATALLSQPKWTDSRSAKTLAETKLPAVLALAYAIDPDGRWCSLAAAWRGKGTRRHVALLHHQAGVQGFAKKVILTARKLKRPVIYDPGRATENVEATAIGAARPRVKTRPLQRMEIPRAAVLLMKTLNSGDLVHYSGQDVLDTAAEIAVKRAFGGTGSWAFGRPDEKNRPEDDVTSLEAASRALYLLDEQKASSGDIPFTGL